MDNIYLQIRREFVIDKAKQVRQAGTVDPHDDWVNEWRAAMEKNLFGFTYVVLGRDYLTPSLHLPVCNWLQRCPPYRKMLLLPRNHAKTSIVSHGLPLHVLIQPINGCYTPYKHGYNSRILLAGEVDTRAVDNLRVVKMNLEENQLLRALWPDMTWDNPRRDAPKWNENEIVIPRTINYPDPSIRAIGVGGAITGARHDVHIKDDLISLEAANSEVAMQRADDWHKTSRALLDNQDYSLEYIIGTRWAVADIYSRIIAEDPLVEYIVRSVIENGELIYPEHFTWAGIEHLKATLGPLFSLLYMNNVGDPSLVDFQMDQLRFFQLVDEIVEYDIDPRDAILEQRYGSGKKAPIIVRGSKLDWTRLAMRAEYLTGNSK